MTKEFEGIMDLIAQNEKKITDIRVSLRLAEDENNSLYERLFLNQRQQIFISKQEFLLHKEKVFDDLKTKKDALLKYHKQGLEIKQDMLIAKYDTMIDEAKQCLKIEHDR